MTKAPNLMEDKPLDQQRALDLLADKAPDLLADVEFRQRTSRFPADAITRFARACCDHVTTRYMFISNIVTEPRQSEVREAFDTLAKRFADLQDALQAIDKALGIHGAIFRLAELEKGSPERHGYNAKQLATKRLSGPNFLANGETFATWLSEHYTRRDGRARWPQPNAQDAGARQDVKEFSALAKECFGRPADVVVARTAEVLLGYKIDPEAVKKLRSGQENGPILSPEELAMLANAVQSMRREQTF